MSRLSKLHSCFNKIANSKQSDFCAIVRNKLLVCMCVFVGRGGGGGYTIDESSLVLMTSIDQKYILYSYWIGICSSTSEKQIIWDRKLDFESANVFTADYNQIYMDVCYIIMYSSRRTNQRKNNLCSESHRQRKVRGGGSVKIN